MGKLILKKGMPECDLHNDLFALHQKYGEVENNEKYWSALCDELPVVAKKYCDRDLRIFAMRMLIALSEYLDSKVAKPVFSEAKAVASIVSGGRSKEEIEEIIKELQKGVSE